MAAVDKILDSGVIALIWKKIFQSMSDGKLYQLVTLKPIDVYQDVMSYELEGAHMDIDITAHLENVFQKPLKRAIDFISNDFRQGKYNFLTYKINVDVDVRMDYPNMSRYLNNQYAGQQYWILDDRIGLYFKEFRLSMKNNQLHVEIPIKLEAKYKKLDYNGEAELFARGNIRYNPFSKKIRITDISYVATSDKWILRMVNLIYYKDIVEALEGFLQFDIQDELDDGLKMLREEVEEYNEELSLISGEAADLNLEWIQLRPEGAVAKFNIHGNVKLLR